MRLKKLPLRIQYQRIRGNDSLVAGNPVLLEFFRLSGHVCLLSRQKALRLTNH
jgi:hypothetical protein